MNAFEKIAPPPPSIYPHVAHEEYAKWDALNFSTLKHANISMRHLKSALDGYADDDTESRKFGRAIHCAILEPDLFSKRFLLSTRCVGVKKSGETCGVTASMISPVPKHWDDFAAQADHVLTQCGYTVRGQSKVSDSVYYENCSNYVRVSDHEQNETTQSWMEGVGFNELRLDSPATIIDQLSTIPGVNLNTVKPLQFWYCKTHKPHDAVEPADFISEAEQERIERIKRALKEHPVIKMLRSQGGQEVCVVGELDGVLCKARLDKLILPPKVCTVIDLKKCQRGKSEMRAFSKSVEEYRYDEQAAFYCDLVREVTGAEPIFKWVAIEDTDDPILEVWNATERHLDVGRWLYRKGLSAYKLGMRTGTWNTYTSFQPKDLLMPSWYGREVDQEMEATINA